MDNDVYYSNAGLSEARPSVIFCERRSPAVAAEMRKPGGATPVIRAEQPSARWDRWCRFFADWWAHLDDPDRIRPKAFTKHGGDGK